MENKNQINFEKFLYVLRKRWIWILLIAVAAGAAAGILTKILVKPQYDSYIKFYVNTTEGQSHMTQSDVNVAKSLVDTYIEILKSDTFLESIAEEADVNYSPAKLRTMMKAQAVNKTEIFKVTITDYSSAVAYKIASAFANKAPDEITRVIFGIEPGETGTVISTDGTERKMVTVVDSPKVATMANGIGTKRNVALAALIAVVAAFAGFFLKEVFDVTIYTEDDITDSFKYPVIGIIPSIVPPNSQEKFRRPSKAGKYAMYGTYGEISEGKEDK